VSIDPGMKTKIDELHKLQNNTVDIQQDQSTSGNNVDRDKIYCKKLPEKEITSISGTIQASSTPVDYSSPARILVIERTTYIRQTNTHLQ